MKPCHHSHPGPASTPSPGTIPQVETSLTHKLISNILPLDIAEELFSMLQSGSNQLVLPDATWKEGSRGDRAAALAGTFYGK